MSKRTVVVTGAAGGLGRAMARQLLAEGFDVVAVARDERSAAATRAALGDHDGLRTAHADLVDRAAVRALASELTGTVHVLINNAGAAFPRYAETADGAERTHALNHLAPFHLTHLLLAEGRFAADARIVTISSNMVTRGRVDPAAPDVTGVSWRDRFSQLTVYGTAKLHSLLATTALAARLPAGMSAYSANPGVIRSGFNASAGGLLGALAPISGLFLPRPETAAVTPLALVTAASPPQPNGGYFAKGRPAAPPASAGDAALTAAVYERTAEVLGIRPAGT